jgi:hypothetical protein
MGSSQAPPPNALGEEQVGSGNYSSPPSAVVFGGGFTDDEFEVIRKACDGKGSVPWLRLDTSLPTPPLGPEYGKHVAERLKATLKSLESEGKLGQDGLYLF